MWVVDRTDREGLVITAPKDFSEASEIARSSSYILGED